jgi:hypothetical protein
MDSAVPPSVIAAADSTKYMRSFLLFLVSQSILLPFIAGLARLRRIGKRYRPFFLLLTVGVCTELINAYLIKIIHGSNAIASNIYTLTEWLLILWQFRVWGVFRTRKNAYLVLLILSCTIWTTENLVFGQILNFSPYFRFFYSFLTVLLSINKINFMITHDDRNLLRHPEFLICIGFIIYFIYKIVYEWAYQASLYGTTEIRSTIVFLEAYINAITNIIFAIAMVKIPAPSTFTLE